MERDHRPSPYDVRPIKQAVWCSNRPKDQSKIRHKVEIGFGGVIRASRSISTPTEEKKTNNPLIKLLNILNL